MSLNKIQSIEEIHDLKLQSVRPMNGDNGSRLGMAQMISALGGYGAYDGYKVITENDTYHILIDNGQSCCESWGYLSSEDDHEQFIGAELLDVTLTDKALNEKAVEMSDYYEENGGIQFVNFKTDKGLFQLAVYNGHNGYYGHSILVVQNEEILLSDTL